MNAGQRRVGVWVEKPVLLPAGWGRGLPALGNPILPADKARVCEGSAYVGLRGATRYARAASFPDPQTFASPQCTQPHVDDAVQWLCSVHENWFAGGDNLVPHRHACGGTCRRQRASARPLKKSAPELRQHRQAHKSQEFRWNFQEADWGQCETARQTVLPKNRQADKEQNHGEMRRVLRGNADGGGKGKGWRIKITGGRNGFHRMSIFQGIG